MLKNSVVLKIGHKKAVDAMNAQMYELCKRMAVECLHAAVGAWDEDKRSSDLTGNIRTSFGAGVYHDRKLKRRFSVFNIEGGSYEKPTRRMTFVGDTNFRIYGTNYYISENTEDYMVMEYSAKHREQGMFFQPTDSNSYGYQKTAAALEHFKPKSDGWVVVIASSTPYGEFLHNVRKLDILESQSAAGEIIKNLKNALYATGNIDKFASNK